MPEAEEATGTVALLVVHGIGAQKPGKTLEKLLNGLGRVDPGSLPKDNPVATVGGQPVRFYEVYWADLMDGDIARGAFQMKELQSLAWFPWFNLRRGNYRPGNYSFVKLAWWCVALPIINFLVLFAYHGIGLLVEIWKGGNERERKRKIAGHSTALTVVHGILDEYAGDVFTYVNSAGNAFYLEEGDPACPPGRERAYTHVVQRFYEQLVKAQADGCATIQIVAHSLGSVVTYHGLSGFRFELDGRDDAEVIRAAIAKVRRVYTIGCPLEKIRFFWPRLVLGASPLGAMKIQWDNFASWFDPLAGILRNFEDWGTVSNHRLLGGGFVRGHVVYEHSPVFLGALTRGLCGRDLPFKERRDGRWRRRLWLVAETLFAPTALAVVLAVGAGLVAIVGLLLPFIASLGLRWVLPPETWVPIVDTASLVVLGLMFLAFLLAPWIRAKKVHALYWAPPPSTHTSPTNDLVLRGIELDDNSPRDGQR